jgi:hypothetical protein
MVVEELSWPDDWPSLLTAESALNPGFFAYGSFPVYLLRVLSWLAAQRRPEWASMGRFYLLGRHVSVLFDTMTVCATYWMGRKVFRRPVIGFLAAGFVTFTVLHIQLSHFYTVDTILTALVMLAVGKAVDVARYAKSRDGALVGVAFGAALATKVSVAPLAIVVLAAWMASAWKSISPCGSLADRLQSVWRRTRGPLLRTYAVTLVCFVALQPYAVIDGHRFVQGVGREIAMSQGWADLPYTRQYSGTMPYAYQVRQLLWFTAGFPLALLGLSGLVYVTGRVVVEARRGRRLPLVKSVWLVWPLIYAVMQGAAYAKFVRYALPLVPFLCIAGATLWVDAWDAVAQKASATGRRQPVRFLLIGVLCIVLGYSIPYALAFIGIYEETHPWLKATSWLCQHMAEGDDVLVEYWDDPLPWRYCASDLGCPARYSLYSVDSYEPESDGKLEHLLDGLQASEYIALSSDRLYATISRLPTRYPVSSRYYHQLFAGELGFELAAAFTVYPQWAGITFRDDPRAGLTLDTPLLLADNMAGRWVLDLGRADESFSVYDHPQPLIFRKVTSLPRAVLAERIRLGP